MTNFAIFSVRNVIRVLCAATVVFGNFAAPAAADDDAVKAVIELIGDKDKDIRALGMQQVREEVKGEAATKQFAALLPKLSPDVQVELIGALATRGDKTARPAVLDCMKNANREVRKAAILAMGPLGDPTTVTQLTELLASSDKDNRDNAEKSLTLLCGSSINAAIASQLPSAKPEVRVALFRVLQSRRATDNAPDILVFVKNADPAVRSAAMAALGQLASPQHVAGMIEGVLKAEPGTERESAEKAVMFVCSREKDPQKRAAPLLVAWQDFNDREQAALLPTLGRVGGDAALKVVDEAIASSNAEKKEAGFLALCRWPDASVAPKYIEIIKTTKNAKHCELAQQSLSRVAVLADKRSAAERLALLKTAMSLATTDEERNYVLQRAKAIRTMDTLRFVEPYLAKPEFAQMACLTVVELAHHRDLRTPNKAEFDRVLDIVIKTSKDADVVDRAQRYKKGQTRAPVAAKTAN